MGNIQDHLSDNKCRLKGNALTPTTLGSHVHKIWSWLRYSEGRQHVLFHLFFFLKHFCNNCCFSCLSLPIFSRWKYLNSHQYCRSTAFTDNPVHVYCIEDITQWHEHMKFIFEWKKYFASEPSKQVKSFFYKKINFICPSQHVIFFLLHRYMTLYECFKN